jgi:hypothetical protein
MKTKLWLTVLTIALVVNVVMMYRSAEGDFGSVKNLSHIFSSVSI